MNNCKQTQLHKKFNADVHLFLKMGKTATSYLSFSAALFCFSLMISASLERKNKQRAQDMASPYTEPIHLLRIDHHCTCSCQQPHK